MDPALTEATAPLALPRLSFQTWPTFSNKKEGVSSWEGYSASASLARFRTDLEHIPRAPGTGRPLIHFQ